jgi:hypothetical protein
VTFFNSYAVGQHVIAKKALNGGWPGTRQIPKGQRGIIRALPSGFFDTRYSVEFVSGTVYAKDRDIKPAMFGGGDESWRKYQQTRQGIALGMFLLAAVPLASWYLSGGGTTELIAAVPGVILEFAGQIIGVLGLPLALVAGLVLWLRSRSH